MKTRFLYISTAFVCLLLSGCSRNVHPSKPLPPGQAKKITGSNSAKAYAPGQQKKKHL